MSKPKVEIIYQDNDIIVINKPSGVSVTKDRSGMPELLDFLAGQLEPQICRQLRGDPQTAIYRVWGTPISAPARQRHIRRYDFSKNSRSTIAILKLV